MLDQQLMKMLFVAFVMMVNAKIRMQFCFVICAISLCTKNVMEFLIFLKDNGFVEDVCNRHQELLTVFCVRTKEGLLNKLTIINGHMWFVLYGYQKFALLTQFFLNQLIVLITFHLPGGNFHVIFANNEMLVLVFNVTKQTVMLHFMLHVLNKQGFTWKWKPLKKWVHQVL